MLVLVQTPIPPGMIPPEVVPIVEMFLTTVAVIALGIPIIRAITRRFERGPLPKTLPASPELLERLDRIEQAVEAVAIEVERIAESQRFSAKLAADQARALPRGDR